MEKEPESSRGLQALGFTVRESSLAPLVRKGDTAFINTLSTDLVHGRVYLVQPLGRKWPCLRRARFIAGRWYLTSDNTSYPDYPQEQCEVLGSAYAIKPRPTVQRI